MASPFPGDDAVSDSGTSLISADESKTKKQNLHILATNYLSRFSHLCSSPNLCLIVTLLVVFASISSLIVHSRNFVCISPFDPKTRVGFFGLDGLESDFGALGVPCCRSKQGKTAEWTYKDLKKGLEEFVPIYDTRPIKNNMYGMGFDHSFGLWFITRWLKPDLMIESGAFKGHSTWVLRQAMPENPIVSVSPRHPEKYLKKGPAYVDENCTYFAGKDFVDFGSMDWRTVMEKHGVTDLSKVLVFFDDHQNELKRVKQALNAGFRHLIFEDNYDTGTGDHYSLRQEAVIAALGTVMKAGFDQRGKISGTRRSTQMNYAVRMKNGGVRGSMRDNFNHSNKQISHEEHFQNSRYIESILDLYWELPPVAGPSLTHQTRFDPARASMPIVEDGRRRLFQRLGLGRLDPSVFNGYTQMVYIQVSELES